MRILYGNILRHFDLERVKNHQIKKKKILPTSDNSSTKNNPRMQLGSVFHKIVNKNKLKIWNFKDIGLVVFQQLRKLELEWKEGGKLFLFLSFLFSVAINFQYKLSSHKSFYHNCQFIFF